MNAMGNLLICGLLQVSLVAIFAIAVISIGSRWSRRWAASLSFWSLLGIVALTVLAMFPLPSWFDQNVLSRFDGTQAKPSLATSGTNAEEAAVESQEAVNVDTDSYWSEVLGASLEGIRNFNRSEDLSQVPTTEIAKEGFLTRSRMVSISFWILGIGIAIGLCRFLGGVLGVYLLVRSSRVVLDRGVVDCVELSQAELNYAHRIEVRETQQLQTAAVVGWRRPVLLLSMNWKQWSHDQLRSVIAHEVAHIARDDYFTNLLAQLGLVLHFYHPLVHWLVRRMRLEQELAADAMAAKLVGGANVYLKAIGELALTQSKERVAWPVQAFLPTRGTFLRRIEMLRGMGTISDRVPGVWRLGSLGVLVGVMLLAVGLRPSFQALPGSVAPEVLVAGEPVPLTPVAEESPFEAKFVPGDASGVIMLRMSKISEQYKQIAADFPELPKEIEELPVVPKGCSEMTIIFGALEQEGRQPQVAMVLKLDSKENRDAAKKKLLRGKELVVERVLFADVEVAGSEAAYNVDEKTLIVGEADWVKQLVVNGPTSKSMLTRTDEWKKGAGGDILVAFDPFKLFNGMQLQRVLGPAFALVSPLISSPQVDTIAIDIEKDLNLKWTIIANHDQFPALAEETLVGIKASLNSMLEGQLQNGPNADLSMALKLLKETKIERESERVMLSMKGDAETLKKSVVMLLAPAIRASRLAAERMQQANNLKLVMLALHNYHDAHGHFPPAIVIDKESGVARSWRVEILPYIEQVNLYNEYRKNEPWDSEANKKVLAKMPSTYRHSSQPGDSVFTSIFAAYGAGMMFEKKSGVAIGLRDVTDGTSNTIAIVEAKRDIPWTKPEEIEFDVTAAKLPDLGFVPEGWQVGFGDGSVRFIARSIDPSLFLKLMTRAGGEVVQ
jgi:beta-lactamase regulating signal transducer with metallopeptidase domain